VGERARNDRSRSASASGLGSAAAIVTYQHPAPRENLRPTGGGALTP
jgi:hypothetical protein